MTSADRLSRIAKGCRWLDKDYGNVWVVDCAYKRAVRLVCLHSRVTLTISDKQRLVTSKTWRPLRGAEFQRSFEITEGSPKIELVRGKLPSAKALAEATPVRVPYFKGPFGSAKLERDERARERRAAAHSKAFAAVVAGPKGKRGAK